MQLDGLYARLARAQNLDQNLDQTLSSQGAAS
jgi:hypothetical protein